MSRSVFRFPYQSEFRQNKERVESYLLGTGYSKISMPNGETVWKKGEGLLSAIRYIKVEFSDREFVISAWFASGVGKFTVREIGFDDFGATPGDRRAFRETIDTLGQLIQ